MLTLMLALDWIAVESC